MAFASICSNLIQESTFHRSFIQTAMTTFCSPQSVLANAKKLQPCFPTQGVASKGKKNDKVNMMYIVYLYVYVD